MTTTRFPVFVLRCVVLLCVLACASPALRAQVNAQTSQSPSNAQTTAQAPAQHKRLTIEITGGDKNAPVENASVYLKFVEGKKIGRDKKYALNVKTNREGVAHIPDPPVGEVLIQIVADGWKTFGKHYELTDPAQTIQIHLDRPPKWY